MRGSSSLSSVLPVAGCLAVGQSFHGKPGLSFHRMETEYVGLGKSSSPHTAAASPYLDASGEAAKSQGMGPICQESCRGLLWGSSHDIRGSWVVCHGPQVARLSFLWSPQTQVPSDLWQIDSAPFPQALYDEESCLLALRGPSGYHWSVSMKDGRAFLNTNAESGSCQEAMVIVNSLAVSRRNLVVLMARPLDLPL